MVSLNCWNCCTHIHHSCDVVRLLSFIYETIIPCNMVLSSIYDNSYSVSIQKGASNVPFPPTYNIHVSHFRLSQNSRVNSISKFLFETHCFQFWCWIKNSLRTVFLGQWNALVYVHKEHSDENLVFILTSFILLQNQLLF